MHRVHERGQRIEGASAAFPPKDLDHFSRFSITFSPKFTGHSLFLNFMEVAERATTGREDMAVLNSVTY